MQCKICNEIFYIRRGILSLFQTKREYICNKCYKKYPLHLSYEAVQLDSYSCVILSMFDKKEYIDYNLFFREYSKLFCANIKRPGFRTFFFDHVALDDNTLETLDAISKLVRSNIIVLCLTVEK